MPSASDKQPTAPPQEGKHKDAKEKGSKEKFANIQGNGKRLTF